MTETNKFNKVIEDFKNITNKPGNDETCKTIMTKVFEQYPDTWFTQGNFCQKLGKRGPMVNQILHDLMDKKVIVRQGSRRQFYYKLNK